jgi:hypothetical protein
MGRQGLTHIIDFTTKISVVEPQAPHPEGGIVYLRIARLEEIETLHALTVREIGEQVAPLSAMLAVYEHNPETLWAIFRSPTENRADGRLVGYYGFLHLNAAGHDALKARTLRPRAPDLSLLAATGERPDAVYIWAVVAKKLSRLTTHLVGKGLGIGRYGGLPFYATAGTMGGLQRIKSYGFHGTASSNDGLGDLFHFFMPGPADRADTAA